MTIIYQYFHYFYLFNPLRNIKSYEEVHTVIQKITFTNILYWSCRFAAIAQIFIADLL